MMSSSSPELRPRLRSEEHTRQTYPASARRLTLPHATLTFRIQGVVDNELAFEDFAVAQPQRAEAVRNPAQPFACGVRVRRMRVGGAHDLAENHKGGIGKLVLFQDRVERHVLAVVAQFDVRYVERR